MVRGYLRGIALAVAALALSACTVTTGGGVAPVVTADQGSALVSQVQQATVAACRFLPAANFVQQLYFQNQNAAVTTASQVAAAICSSLQPRPQYASTKAGSARLGSLRGLPLEGRFVGKG